MSTYIGYFLFDGFEIGLSPLGYSNDHNTVFDISDKKKYYLTISQINTYFSLAYNINLNKNYYPYVQISYGYIEAKSSSNLEFFSSSKSSGNGYGIRAGIKYSIVQHALLNFGISYQSVSVDEEDPSSQLSFSSGVSIWF
jgi:outer membrane protein W